MSQHHYSGLVPTLGNFNFILQGAHIHDLARVPDRHLDEWIARCRPQIDRWVWNRAVEPELIRLIGCKVLVWQVGVVVSVQAGHLNLTAVVANEPFTQGQSCAIRGQDSVVRHVLAGVYISPNPFVIRYGYRTEAIQSRPSRIVGGVLQGDCPHRTATTSHIRQKPNRTRINWIGSPKIHSEVAVCRILLAIGLNVLIVDIGNNSACGRCVATIRAVHGAIEHV